MDKLHSADNIAQFFIGKAHKDGKIITNKKLQKIIYYAQAWSLAVRNKPLFNEEIEAWVHGPVVKSVYLKYKQFGYNNIPVDTDTKIKFTSDEEKFLENIWQVYGKKDADYLELLSHNEEPWQMAREGIDETQNSSNIISHESMRVYYSNLLNTP